MRITREEYIGQLHATEIFNLINALLQAEGRLRALKYENIADLVKEAAAKLQTEEFPQKQEGK